VLVKVGIRLPLLGLITSLVPFVVSAQTILTEGTNIHADASTVDGSIAFDLLGSIWILPANGGEARELPNTVLPARSPKWSPSGEYILYQASSPTGNRLWLHDVHGNTPRPLNSVANSDQDASWHPDGERIVFSSASDGSGLDLWELDIPTGLRWRITDRVGDETEAAWSANGKHLVYVSHDEHGWSLMLRRFGEADQRLLQSPRSIRAPSWRPDGSLITYLRETDDGYSFDMVILSDPPLSRQYSDLKQDYFLSPVSWLDRHRMIYAADGQLFSRDFDARRATPLHFRANTGNTASRPERAVVKRRLPAITPPADRLVIRAARLFDGVQDGYRHDMDVVVDGATISAVEARQDWSDATVLDLGNVTILPGFIDIYSALPNGDDAGASLLAYGITTLVSDDPPGSLRPDLWHGAANPGPRLISAGNIASQGTVEKDDVYLVTVPANTALESAPRKLVRSWRKRGVPVLAENWTVGLGLGVDLLLGANTLPSSPQGIQYQDMRAAISNGPVILVSGLADSGTPGLVQLLSSRQARRFHHNDSAVRHYATQPQLRSDNSSIVLGSKPNGLPPGLALHAELRALAAAGLSGDQVLRAAGANIGKSLGLETQIGVVTPGAFADLVLVTGDPLLNVADTLKIVAVVRNGRFYSLVRLLESAEMASATP
jgi:WD40 repeat protein